MKLTYNDKQFLRKKYAELGNGNLIAQELGLNKALVYRWLKQYGITNKKLTRRSVNETFFNDIDTEEKAYWLGFIMADGCVYKGASNNSYVFQINLQRRDKEMLVKLNQTVQSTYNIVDITIDNYEVSKLKISNTIFCKGLMKHGVVPRKSLICQMPIIDKNLQWHFIRGLFDGDGCLYQNKQRNKWRWSIVGNFKMLISIQEILYKHNISSAIYLAGKSQVFDLQISCHGAIEKVYKLLYNEATVYLPRKKEKFKQFIMSRLTDTLRQ